MTIRRFVFPLSIALLVSGCNSADMADNGSGTKSSHGRYVGIGVVPTSSLWTQLDLTKPDKVDPAAATLGDDEHVIIVVDTRTGEVRQCGDMSGICTSMDPWAQKHDVSRKQPVKLLKHASDLVREAEARHKAQAEKAQR